MLRRFISAARVSGASFETRNVGWDDMDMASLERLRSPSGSAWLVVAAPEDMGDWGGLCRAAKPGTNGSTVGRSSWGISDCSNPPKLASCGVDVEVLRE